MVTLFLPACRLELSEDEWGLKKRCKLTNLYSKCTNDLKRLNIFAVCILSKFPYWWMCPWLCPPVFWLQSHRAGRQCRLLHSLLWDHKGDKRNARGAIFKCCRESERGMQYHTNEVVPHLIQHWLHVVPGQTLRPHQALEHPKHATKTAPLFGAEITNDSGLCFTVCREKHWCIKMYTQ